MSRKHVIFATVYDKRGRVISHAKNSYTKSHPIQAHFAKLSGQTDRIFLHAEIAALLKCGDIQPHKIKIERYSKDDRPLNATPCPICALAIKEWGVKLVEHTT